MALGLGEPSAAANASPRATMTASAFAVANGLSTSTTPTMAMATPRRRRATSAAAAASPTSRRIRRPAGEAPPRSNDCLTRRPRGESAGGPRGSRSSSSSSSSWSTSSAPGRRCRPGRWRPGRCREIVSVLGVVAADEDRPGHPVGTVDDHGMGVLDRPGMPPRQVGVDDRRQAVPPLRH